MARMRGCEDQMKDGSEERATSGQRQNREVDDVTSRRGSQGVLLRVLHLPMLRAKNLRTTSSG